MTQNSEHYQSLRPQYRGVTKLQAQDSFNLAYKRADKALYQSKSDGRNCCRWN
ncbi:hypothetical protein [Idiomarina sp.]|uniref:hypothetical protein n=1 Tax=Idiomarina sp. TaxID=1874361 RepID=UPI002588CEC1|nr:hypothetical protein [Idiomarina sp.]